MIIRDLMNSNFVAISSYKSVKYASEMMSELKVGSLIVMDHESTVLGIVTSRDIRTAHPNRIVADAMTQNPISILSQDFAWDALKIMEYHQIERLLVIENEKPVGIVTRESIKVKLSELYDPLTSLYRAPYIQIIGSGFLKKHEPFQLLFIDLDKFGEINKTYGHPVGDEVIHGYAVHIKSIIEENIDFLCRYAGDEFVVITCRKDIRNIVKHLSRPIIINKVKVSSSVGIVNGFEVDNFFDHSFYDIVKKASLDSTLIKKNNPDRSKILTNQ